MPSRLFRPTILSTLLAWLTLARPAQAQVPAHPVSFLPPSPVVGIRVKDIRRIEYVDRSDLMQPDARIRGEESVPNVGPVVVEGDGLDDVAAAFLKAFDSSSYRRFIQTHGLSRLVTVRLFLKGQKGQANPEKEPLILSVAPWHSPATGPELQQAFAALGRWQARDVARRVRPRLEGSTETAQVTKVRLHVSLNGWRGQTLGGYAWLKEIASDPAAVRPLLEAMCHLDGRAFAYTKEGQTAFVRLMAPDGTEEVIRLYVAIFNPRGEGFRPNPGISRMMANPPLPRPLWERVYDCIYGGKEP